jgi:2-oxoglutarate ferredoxin oxidoreductase subunit beta
MSTTTEKSAAAPLTRKDFASDQEVRWCPGCGDYAILAQMQKIMPELEIPRENIVFVSGIGCSSRFPYYMNTYGVHSIHGRAPTLATGLKLANPELKVFVITGDGDALSIGGNHLLHVLRRNVDLTVVLFNNRIYGLTKGQFSPTSPPGSVTKSSPMGSLEQPLNPLSVALAAEATFVARSIDVETRHLQDTLAAAARHKGASFVEVLQNCNIFNDGAWFHVTKNEDKEDHLLRLEAGQPLRFGTSMQKELRLKGMELDVQEVGSDSGHALIHDPGQDSGAMAYALSRMTYPAFPVPIGIFRQVERPTYDDGMTAQVHQAQEKKGHGDLLNLYLASETWKVGGDGQASSDMETLKREIRQG